MCICLCRAGMSLHDCSVGLSYADTCRICAILLKAFYIINERMLSQNSMYGMPRSCTYFYSHIEFEQVSSAAKILELLHVGNSRRKTERTDANAISSR